jgi:hypothetical protein
MGQGDPAASMLFKDMRRNNSIVHRQSLSQHRLPFHVQDHLVLKQKLPARATIELLTVLSEISFALCPPSNQIRCVALYRPSAPHYYELHT